MLKISSIVYIITFIIISISIFFIKNIEILAYITVLNLLFILVNKLMSKFYPTLKMVIPILILTVISNSLFDNWKLGFVLGFRMFNCYMFTFNFSKMITIKKLSKGIKNLFFPLKIFGINIEKIEIIVSIALCMMPCLINELKELKKYLKLKGIKPNYKSYILIIKAQFILILKKVNFIEKNMILKGYQE